MPHACIIPPHMLRSIAEHGDPGQRRAALQTLLVTEQFRGVRLGRPAASVARPDRHRAIYTAAGGYGLPGRPARGEGDDPTGDPAVDEAYDGLGATYDLFHDTYGRHSLDDSGLRLDATVHYGRGYDNAFWDGAQMVFGDGDGRLFMRFTSCLEVIGHELAHGVTDYEAKLTYQGQPGALNQSFSDVLGILVKHHARRISANEATWIIGEGLLAPGVRGRGLRSMKAPGTAYDDPVLGRDPQPATMKDYVDTDEDNGGVHLNSGIPNRAFYLAAEALGGFAWERAGRIWYVALRDRLKRRSSFAQAAALTRETAAGLYGRGSLEQQGVSRAWREVGVQADAPSLAA